MSILLKTHNFKKYNSQLIFECHFYIMFRASLRKGRDINEMKELIQHTSVEYTQRFEGSVYNHFRCQGYKA